MSTNMLAARAVVRRVSDPVEARELLAMLGLIAEDGQIAPDNVRSYALPKVDGGREEGLSVPLQKWLTDKPEKSNAPELLRNIPKPKLKNMPPQEHNIARIAPCGTEAAVRRHQRHGEPLDQLCKGYRALRYRKGYEKLHAPCGTFSAYERHKRNGDFIDEACRVAYSAYRRARRQRAKAKQ